MTPDNTSVQDALLNQIEVEDEPDSPSEGADDNKSPELPKIVVQNEPLNVAKATRFSNPPKGEILFVDDSAMNLQVAKNLVEDLGLTA